LRSKSLAELSEAVRASATVRSATHPAADGARPVRVLMTGVPMVHGAERVLELIEAERQEQIKPGDGGAQGSR